MSNFWQNLSRPFTVLAPMDDVTDIVFRSIIEDLGRPDVFFTEFTSTDTLCSVGKDRALKKLEYQENQHPIVAQIWGANPQNIFKSAKLIKDLGFDGVDINMGCPARDVMKKSCGSGAIGNFSLTQEVITAVKEGAKGLAISVKTRLGKNEIEENWIPFLLEQKLDALTIHGRIAKQLSTGNANWEEIGKAADLKNKISPQTMLIGNGDIKSLEEVNKVHQLYGVDGVMIGTGIFSNPWLFNKDQSSHSKEERVELLLKHLRLFEEKFPKKQFPRLKKYFKIYLKEFNGANELRQKLMETNSAQEIQDLLLPY